MSEETSWEEAPEASELTLKELTSICQAYADKRAERDELDAKAKAIGKEADEMEAKILAHLTEYGMPNFKGAFGTVSIRNTKTVTQPESLEEKLKFFEYLKEQGIYDSMVSVNSRTLSSWATKEIEAKEKDGVFGWAPPGLKLPQTFQKVTLARTR